MLKLTFNGNTYDVHHAVKGPDYVHGYDVDGNCVVALNGVTDFSNITYTGVYMDPDACADELCNVVRYYNNKLMTGDGREIMPRTTALDFAKFYHGNFYETLSNGDTVGYNVEFGVDGSPVRISDNNGNAIDIVWGVVSQ